MIRKTQTIPIFGKRKLCRIQICHQISQRFYPLEQVGQACDKEYTASAAQVRFPSTRPLSCVVKISLRRRRRLVLIIKKYGEESFARRIAANIVKNRTKKPFLTTFELKQTNSR